MNIDCGIALDVLSVVFMAAMLAGLRTTGADTVSNRLYFSLLSLVALFLLSDIVYLAFLGSGDAFAQALGFAAKNVYFMANALIIWIWARYVDYTVFGSESRHRMFKVVYTAILAFNLLLVVANLFTGCLFGISESGQFVVGDPFLWIYTVLNYSSAAVALSMLFARRAQLKASVAVPLVMFPLIPAVAEIVQLVNHDISLACTYAVSSFMLYQIAQSNLIYTDELTGLGSRRALSERLGRWFSGSRSANICGIMIDLNDLKHINDVYGHASGDDALETIADIIRKSAPKSAVSVRHGGDEFVMVWDAEDGPTVAETIARLEANKAAVNASPALWGDTDFSIGSACCSVSECKDSEEFLRLLDGAMYKDKRRRKAAVSNSDAR